MQKVDRLCVDNSLNSQSYTQSREQPGLAEAVEAIGQLTLDRREEALHHGVIVAVTAATHATDDAPCAQNRLVVLARVGAALVGSALPPRFRSACSPFRGPLRRVRLIAGRHRQHGRVRRQDEDAPARQFVAEIWIQRLDRAKVFDGLRSEVSNAVRACVGATELRVH